MSAGAPYFHAGKRTHARRDAEATPAFVQPHGSAPTKNVPEPGRRPALSTQEVSALVSYLVASTTDMQIESPRRILAFDPDLCGSFGQLAPQSYLPVASVPRPRLVSQWLVTATVPLRPIHPRQFHAITRRQTAAFHLLDDHKVFW